MSKVVGWVGKLAWASSGGVRAVVIPRGLCPVTDESRVTWVALLPKCLKSWLLLWVLHLGVPAEFPSAHQELAIPVKFSAEKPLFFFNMRMLY